MIVPMAPSILSASMDSRVSGDAPACSLSKTSISPNVEATSAIGRVPNMLK